jgi:hypothetical protein
LGQNRFLKGLLGGLGLSQNLASLWKNPSTGAAYGSLSTILKNETIRTKNTRVVATPNLISAL